MKMAMVLLMMLIWLLIVMVAMVAQYNCPHRKPASTVGRSPAPKQDWPTTQTRQTHTHTHTHCFPKQTHMPADDTVPDCLQLLCLACMYACRVLLACMHVVRGVRECTWRTREGVEHVCSTRQSHASELSMAFDARAHTLPYHTHTHTSKQAHKTLRLRCDTERTHVYAGGQRWAARLVAVMLGSNVLCV